MEETNNRARVILRPMGEGDAPIAPKGMTLLAIMDAPRTGWLARSGAGALVCWTGNAVASVDPRKAAAALADLDSTETVEIDPAELARAVKNWRGSMSGKAAASALGLSYRTLEGVEQGRGFRYPRLLILAIKSADLHP